MLSPVSLGLVFHLSTYKTWGILAIVQLIYSLAKFKTLLRVNTGSFILDAQGYGCV